MTDLTGKTALITGASSGIGEAIAKQFADAGIKVALAARRKDRLDTLVKSIEKAGGTAMAIEADVTIKEICNKVVEQVVSKWGKIDILVNNAGVMLLGPMKEAPIEEWENMIQLNVMGLMYMTYAVLPTMHEKKAGHIINISSVAGRTVNSGSGVYNATKWGVNAFTEGLRQELVADKTNVRTTLIEPGAVETELRTHNRPEVQDMISKRFGDIKILEADDIAASAMFAVSQPAHVNINEILIRPTDQPG